MCGIFGVLVPEYEGGMAKALRSVLRDLYLQSETRGKEASGIALATIGHLEILRAGVPGSDLSLSALYEELLHRGERNALSSSGSGASTGKSYLAAVGHSRLVTTGSQVLPLNNQPVLFQQTAVVHNGIIVNQDEIWSETPNVRPRTQVDTEVIAMLAELQLIALGSIQQAIQRTFQRIQGQASVAIVLGGTNCIVLATNNGSLYRTQPQDGGPILFASERRILETLGRKPHVRQLCGQNEVVHVRAGESWYIDLSTGKCTNFPLGSVPQESAEPAAFSSPREIVERNESAKSAVQLNRKAGLKRQDDAQGQEWLDRIRRRFPHDAGIADSLRRCTRCILPETMPFIEFDEQGLCNFCQFHRPILYRGRPALDELAGALRATKSPYDCLVGLSGGRDSMYGIHYLRTQLGLNPLAYTYDWGMVTDLARRNVSRICGKLGIEHILVSADITRKREHVRKNVAAWLKRPELGMIPLFMAGDKQYFYFAQKVRKETGSPAIFLCENMLERTNFKTGYAGVAPAHDDKHVYTLPLGSKLRLAAYYSRQYLRNPAYINSSLWDSALAFGCYYLIDRNYHNLYNYVPWVEDDVVPTLVGEYGFELSDDTKSTWRIGDGTSAFYNYIYYVVAGFTEIDCLRSNQVREGHIDRARALELAREENRPRFRDLRDYLELINLDASVEEVLDVIHRIPRRYSKPA